MRDPSSKDSLPIGFREQLQAIQLTAEVTNRLAQDLSVLAGIEADDLSLKRAAADVRAMVREAVARLAPAAKSREVRLAARMPDRIPAIDCDCDRTLQVITNLLGNAIKFTPAGGTVELAARAAAHEIVFAVTDSGPGIAPEERRHLFEKYWRSKHPEAGSGLRSFIAKSIIDAHGGRIWADSSEAGAVFHFSLPIAHLKLASFRGRGRDRARRQPRVAASADWSGAEAAATHSSERSRAEAAGVTARVEAS